MAASGVSVGNPRWTYLGPEGTFTEAALRTIPGAEAAEAIPLASVPAALDAVRRGEADTAVVPLENSVEGSVSVTLDELATGEPLVIEREILLPISFALLVRPGTAIEDIKTVSSHSHAQPQVRRWLAANLPDAHWFSSASNADAARLVQEGRYDAALAGEFAAARYGLVPLVTDIHDVEGAVTRFVQVRRPGAVAAPTGADRTSVVAFIVDDHAGALLEILQEFAVRGVNLDHIQSRPTGDGLGHYFFAIEAEGHIGDARVGEALMGLRRVCAAVRFLGSYPRADGVRPQVRRGTSDPEFENAAQWLDRCRRGEV
ncbi:prephenate dehydratase [Yinghuangia soli]|uniref:Prephenate dehydratase n=1 Tax=Yinghuangia soli TaxID=2908204 RepID=A0AA41TYR0_9ACTN|nr:prephenate dehydratase [Yinghuangia soli]MCF2526455.1 prephenate dehydratase [Yinghuangia soli]